MSPPLRQIVPATLLLSSLTYFSTTITHMRSPGGTSTIELEISSGRILGVKKVSRNGQRGFYHFRGIPYAEQPVGELRFEPPIPAKTWKHSVLDATRYGAFCLQLGSINPGIIQGERCLFLNVAVPKGILPIKTKYNGTIKKPKKVYPVIVYFHGGGFMTGFSNVYDASYFMDENVVFVSINYRVGFLGFLNTGDDVVRGNMGLKDQNMALRWVQENIAFFGGDRNRVTLMGQSAGGASCHFHILSPMSRGLFHRAISHSGVAVNNFAITKNPRDQALRLGRRLRCPTNNTREMVACLKTLPEEQLNEINTQTNDLLSGNFAPFVPSVEAVHDSNTFLFDTPRNLIRQRIVTNVPWIVGLNTNEALYLAIRVIQNRTATDALNREWKRYAPIIFDYEGHSNADYISALIRHKYLGGKEISRATLRETALMVSDRFFVEGIHEGIHSHASLSPVYAYYFTYQGEFALATFLAGVPSFLPRPIGILYTVARNWFGKIFRIRPNPTERIDGSHLDELPLFFPIPVIHRILPGNVDYPMSREVIKAWTHFASTGKPAKIFGVEWTPVLLKDQFSSVQYLKLDADPAMIPEPFTARVQFWKSLHLDIDEPHHKHFLGCC